MSVLFLYMCVCASHRAQKCRRLTSHACFAHTFYFLSWLLYGSSTTLAYTNGPIYHMKLCTVLSEKKHASKAAVRGSQIAVIYIRVKRDSQENFVLVNSFYDTVTYIVCRNCKCIEFFCSSSSLVLVDRSDPPL